MYACLAVTCHLHFWQNDRDFLRATVVTRGWNGYRNKSQHRKSTLEKKILPPFQQGFEPATFQSRVRCSNHWAIPAPAWYCGICVFMTACCGSYRFTATCGGVCVFAGVCCEVWCFCVVHRSACCGNCVFTVILAVLTQCGVFLLVYLCVCSCWLCYLLVYLYVCV